MLNLFKNIFQNINYYPPPVNYSPSTPMPYITEIDDLYPSPGDIIGGFPVIDIAGCPGGTAIVLICSDRGRKIAIKRFYKDKCIPQFKDKIFEEASLKIKNNCIVGAEACFQEGDYFHSVMNFVEGEPLCNILDGGVIFCERDAVFIAICLACAIIELHSKNMLSTDIKPGNIILGDNGYAILIDLSCWERPGRKSDFSLGTPPYSSPELLKKKRLHASTDIYSIGVVLLEMLIGTIRFSAISERWERDLKRGIKPDISFLRMSYPKSSRVIEKAMEYEPELRYQSGIELLSELKELYRNLTNSKRMCILLSGQKEIIPPEGISILGRDAISPDNCFISEKLFESDFTNGRLRINDMSRKNDVYVNKKLSSNPVMELVDGDSIHIANAKLHVNIR